MKRLSLAVLMLIIFLPLDGYSSGFAEELDSLRSIVYNESISYQIKRKHLESLLNAAEKQENASNNLEVLLVLSELNMFMSDFNSASDNLKQGAALLNKVDNNHLKINYYYLFGKLHSLRGNHKASRTQFEKALNMISDKDQKKPIVKLLYNALGNTYLDTNQDSLAINYYEKSIKIYSDPELDLIPAHNIIQILLKNGGRNSELLDKIDQLLYGYQKKESSVLIATCYLLYADFYKNRNNQKLSLEYIRKSLSLANEENLPERKIRAYKALYDHHKSNKNFELALGYKETYHKIRDSLENSINQKEINDLLVYYRTISVEQELQLEREKNISAMQKIQVNKLYLIVSLTTGVLLFLIVVIIWLKNKNSKAIYQKAMELKEAELKYQQKDLSNLATDIIRRNQFAKSISKDITHILSTKNKDNLDEKLRLISNSIKNHMYVNKGLKGVNSKVDRISVSLYSKINMKHPNLTRGEKKLCALLMLDLPQSDLATILGIATTSVANKKHRLKKKIGLTAEQDICQYISNL